MADVVGCSDCGKKFLGTRLIRVKGSRERVCSACQVKRFRNRMGMPKGILSVDVSDKMPVNGSWYRDTEWFVKVFCAQCGHPEWASRSKWKPPPGYVEPKEPSMWDVPLT